MRARMFSSILVASVTLAGCDATSVQQTPEANATAPAAPTATAGSPATTTTAAEKTFTRTIVDHDADGNLTKHSVTLTRTQQLRLLEQEFAGRNEALPASLAVELAALPKSTGAQPDNLYPVDSSCSSSSFHMFDQTSYAGDELCLENSGSGGYGWLADYVFNCHRVGTIVFCSDWAAAVRSYVSPTTGWYYYNSSTSTYCSPPVGEELSASTADSCIQEADQFYFTVIN